MRVSILKHSCNMASFANMMAQFISKSGVKKDFHNCPFYWRMKGGKTYIGSIHYFTLFGYRVVINLVIKKKREDLWIR